MSSTTSSLSIAPILMLDGKPVIQAHFNEDGAHVQFAQGYWGWWNTDTCKWEPCDDPTNGGTEPPYQGQILTGSALIPARFSLTVNATGGHGESPHGTTVSWPSTNTIVDSFGNVWGITP